MSRSNAEIGHEQEVALRCPSFRVLLWVLTPSENRRRAKPRSSDKIWFGQSAQLSSAFVGKLPFFRCILSSSV